MDEAKLEAVLEAFIRASQANFDHLLGQAREQARRFNQLSNDVADLYELLGVRYVQESNEETPTVQGPNLDMQEHTHENSDEGGQHDHGAAHTGLTDDDHTQYLKEEASGGLASEVPDHLHTSGAEAGTLDHGAALTGLTDDDHTQYLKEKASGGLASEVPTHTHADAANAGTVDHGQLINLTGDHDAEYINEGQAAGGDLGGTYPNPTVTDDSHSHTAATVPAGSGSKMYPHWLGA